MEVDVGDFIVDVIVASFTVLVCILSELVTLIDIVLLVFTASVTLADNVTDGLTVRVFIIMLVEEPGVEEAVIAVLVKVAVNIRVAVIV